MLRYLLILLCIFHGGTCQGDDLAGRWQLSIDIPGWQVEDVRTRLEIRARGAGQWRGDSPRFASFRMLGFWRGALAAVLEPSLRRGAWISVHLESGTDGQLESKIQSAFLSALEGHCRLAAQTLECEYRREGRAFAVLRARRDAEGRTQQYADLGERIHATLRAHHHHPALIEDARWQAPLRVLARRLGKARDDLDVLAAWQGLARRWPDSHLALLRSAGDSAGAEERRLPSLEWRGDVAILKVEHWSVAPADMASRLADLFGEIQARPAGALIVDLRGNGGGNLSSMLLAAHLLGERSALGYFTTRHWWDLQTQAPTPALAHHHLPEFSGADVETLRRALADGPGVYAWVEPRAPHYRGPVQVLQDRATASANEPLLALLQRSGRATLVGQTSAGAMLSSEAFELAPGWQLRVPVADFHTADGLRLEGRGVQPDLEVASERALEQALVRARSQALAGG